MINCATARSISVEWVYRKISRMPPIMIKGWWRSREEVYLSSRVAQPKIYPYWRPECHSMVPARSAIHRCLASRKLNCSSWATGGCNQITKCTSQTVRLKTAQPHRKLSCRADLLHARCLGTVFLSVERQGNHSRLASMTLQLTRCLSQSILKCSVNSSHSNQYSTDSVALSVNFHRWRVLGNFSIKLWAMSLAILILSGWNSRLRVWDRNQGKFLSLV